MATIKELLSTMIDKINGNEDKINNIKGVPEAFDSITMTNGTDTANLTMSAEKELLFNGEAVGGSGGGKFVVTCVLNGETGEFKTDKTASEIYEAFCKGLIPELHATNPEDSEVTIMHLDSTKPSLTKFINIGLAGNTENADVLLTGVNIYNDECTPLFRMISGN